MADWTEKYNEQRAEVGRLMSEIGAAIDANHTSAFADDPTNGGYVYDLADLRIELNRILKSFGGYNG